MCIRDRLTIVMMLGLVLMKVDFGPMAKFERNAIENNDLFSGSNPYAMLDEEIDDTKGTVMDLVLPIAVLVVCCVIGMIYSCLLYTSSTTCSAPRGPSSAGRTACAAMRAEASPPTSGGTRCWWVPPPS